MKVLKKKSINLYKKYTENPEAQNQRRQRALFIVPALVIFVGISAVTGVLVYERAMLRDDIKALEAVNNSDENAALEEELFSLRAKVDFYSNAEANASKISAALASSTRMNSEFFKKLSDAAASVIKYELPDYKLADHYITIKASAPAKNDISAYVKRLSATEFFSDVYISGYEFSKSSGRFNFSVRCSFKPFDLTSVIDAEELAAEETTKSDGITLDDINSFFSTKD